MMSVGRNVIALSLVATLWPDFAAAQKAGVVTALEGNVTATRAAVPQPVVLKFKDDVFVNDRVVIGDRSLARLLLGGKAVVTVRERSALTITEVPGRSTIDLKSGTIAAAVAQDKMRPGEQIEVRTPNGVASVRGTAFIVEIVNASMSDGNAQGGTAVNHYVLTGEIVLTVGARVLTVPANNFASVTGGVVSSGIMNALMRARAGAGFAPRRMPMVSGAKDDAKQAVMKSTVAALTAGTLPIVEPPPPVPPTIQPPQVQQALLPGGGQDSFVPTPAPRQISPGPTPQPPLPPPAPPPPPRPDKPDRRPPDDRDRHCR